MIRFRGLSLLLVLACFSLVATACPADDTIELVPPEDAPEPGDPPDDDAAEAERRIERHIFDAVNAEREERGIDPLEWSDQLTEGARYWSGEMAAEGAIEHQDGQAILDGVEGLTAVGENVFQATAPVPAATIHVGWMRSDGHRRNVLDAGFDHLGVGVVCTDDGEVFATQRFGRTAAADLPPVGDDEIPPEAPIVADPDEGPSC